MYIMVYSLCYQEKVFVGGSRMSFVSLIWSAGVHALSKTIYRIIYDAMKFLKAPE